MKDPLYFPRTELAAALLGSLKSGISSAFTLFAPRRMGKTQFLTNDIAPAAEKDGFNVFYFSFMDNRDTADPARFFHTPNHKKQPALQFPKVQAAFSILPIFSPPSFQPRNTCSTPLLANASARSFSAWPAWPFTHCQRTRCRATCSSSCCHKSAFFTGWRPAVFQPFFFQL